MTMNKPRKIDSTPVTEFANVARERVFQVSSNRGNARHRMRYVEASAPAEGECRLCVGTLSERS